MLNNIAKVQVELLKVIIDLDFMGNIREPAETILLEGACRNIFKL